MVKKDLPLRGNLRNDVREMTACSTHPDCPSLTTWYGWSGIVEINGGNFDVRVKSVLVEQYSTSTIMSHVEMTRQNNHVRGTRLLLAGR